MAFGPGPQTGRERTVKTLMFYCTSCKTYTLEETCPRCGSRAKVPMPARFSPEDHYGEYRRKLLRQV